MSNNINSMIAHATKWSTITEIVAKLITPITTLILARILTPKAFGVIATITMIISFADMFTDAGFQKYLIQHEFIDEDQMNKSTTVAFWTNLAISLLLWVVIAIFCEPIATLVGNPGLGSVLLVACISLPLTSFSSIQIALYRRSFDYKKLFIVKIVGIFVPFVVTIPLALLGFNYWALIIGIICGNLSNAFILTIKSKWKITRYYSLTLLKDMLSFSLWSLVEAISIWLASWSDTFIISSTLSVYYLGIYKTSMSTVNGIMAIITGATTTILFSALSRLQNNVVEYNKTFFKFQRLVGFLVLPMGVGIYMYRDLITNIILGSQWKEASLFIGLWGLTSSITIIFANYCSEIYRSKGKPKLSVLVQILHIIVLIPVIFYSVKYSFTTLVYARSFIRLHIIIVDFIFIYFFFKISPWKMILNVMPSMICSFAMGYLANFLQKVSSNLFWDLFSILLCSIFYLAFILLFPNMRKELIGLFKHRKDVLISPLIDIV